MGKGTWIGAMATGGMALVLSGCGLPPAITAASWALDGVSFVATGKSVTDHAISEVSQRDCALFRVVQEKEICRDFEAGDTTLLASLEADVSEDDDRPAAGPAGAAAADGAARGFAFGPRPAPRAAVQVTQADTGPGDIRPAAWTVPADPVVVPREEAWLETALPGTVLAAAPQAATPAQALAPSHAVPAYAVPQETAPKPARSDASEVASAAAPVSEAGFGRWAEPVARPSGPRDAVRAADAGALARLGRTNAAVVGSFADRGNAVALAANLADLDARVLQAEVDGRAFHRVVVDAPAETLRARGFADAWTVHLCAGTGALPPCAPAGRAVVELASAG